MKKIVSILTICLFGASAVAATPAPDRRSMAAQWGSAPRATLSRNQISNVNRAQGNGTDTTAKTTNTREKEKEACINNNIGMGNTFVWASRYSNTANYASMVEDTEVPENNVCFVRVELKSDDAKISVSDIAPVYYEMGRNITCGEWTNTKKLESRILDAKKSARTWGTVAGAVGGAGVGVGAMELFGNKLIGGSVEGQKGLNEDELLRSQLLVMKEKNKAQFETLRNYMEQLQTACEDPMWNETGAVRPDDCTKINYNILNNLK